MTYRQAIVAIQDRLRLGFVALPVVVDPNAEATPPATGFVELFTTWGEELQTHFGGSSVPHQAHASADIGIYVPRNRGQGAAWGYVDAICALFRGLVLPVAGGTLEFKGTRPEIVDGGQFFQINLILTFEVHHQLALAS